MDKVVGVLGGGQLGRMFIESANRLGIKVNVLDAANSPAKQISFHSDHVDGSFKNANDVEILAARSDVLTIEIEHVDVPILHKLAAEGKEIHPRPETIEMIQDKYEQKLYYGRQGIATPQSREVSGQTDPIAAVKDIGAEFGYPLMLKAKRDAYDGRGNAVVKDENAIEEALKSLGRASLYAEKWCPFEKELAVMVVKTDDGATKEDWETTTKAFPVVETVHQDSICKLTYCPPRGVPQEAQTNAVKLARRAVAGFKGRGIYGVEMFLLADGQLLVNEIAPRPHNSGHYTIDACRMSQYEAHLRSILGLPILDRDLEPHSPSIMLNILGGVTGPSHLELAKKALSVPGARIHLYGKGAGRPGRKMGHVTVTAPTVKDAESSVAPLIEAFDAIREATKKPIHLPAQRVAKPSRQTESSEDSLDNKNSPEGVAKVGVTMGSDSDLPNLKAGLALLDQLQIPRRVAITSAHRTPEEMFKYAQTAQQKGYKVLIAGAGGAAHLPGMLASGTTLPVIGVPIVSQGSVPTAAIHSILDMPRGCPVATVAPNNSVNAALLAARILANEDPALRTRYHAYVSNQKKEVLEKAEKLQKQDYRAYLEQKQG